MKKILLCFRKPVFTWALVMLTLTACGDRIEHTVYEEGTYGPRRSTLGRASAVVERPENCFGLTEHMPGCRRPWKLADKIKKDPTSALTPDVLDLIKSYAANAAENTSTYWTADKIVYKLEFNSPEPKKSKGRCRQVDVKVKAAGSKMDFQDLSREFCF